MAGRIPENILDDILARIDIAEVIAGYIPLKRAGRNFKTLCPFHQEKTPSFMVSPDRQIYHCFGCGESGNAFKFLMRYERLDFIEAVEILAKKSGVVLPEKEKDDDKKVSLYTQLYKINELAALFYHQALNSATGEPARNYLAKRGINEATVKLFKIGLASDSWDALINHLRAKGVPLSLLEKAGLILPKERGGYYDRFRNRIIFPIFDVKSRALAFGARVFVETDKNSAKYINSPETPIYIKGRNLYGLNLSKDAIRENDCAVVVEGYFDFIIPYQAGVENVVASLGTALTEEQARLLKRYTHNITMVYDADDAGQMATLRTLDIFIEEGMNVKIASLPKDSDPDLFVRQAGIESLRQKIQQAEGLFDYKLRALKSRYNIKEIEGKAMISSEMLPTINKFKHAVLKFEYLRKLAEELALKEDVLLEELKKIKESKPYSVRSSFAEKKALNINPTEKLLIKLMLEETELINYIRQHLKPADFQDERISRIVSVMFDFIEEGRKVSPGNLINHLDNEEILQCICESAFLSEVPAENKEKIVDDCIQRLKGRRLLAKRQSLQEEIKEAEESGDETRLHRLKEEFHQLIRKGEEAE